MRSLALLAATAAFSTFASAAVDFTPSNGTHFLDPHSHKEIKHFGCGAHVDNAPDDFLKTIKKLHKEQKRGSIGTRAPRTKIRKQVSTPFTIPTYLHAITTSAKQGSITQDMANAQVAALNKAYNRYGIKFELKDTTFTANDAWAVANGPDMDAAKAGLRAGTYGSLNLYFHSDFAGGNLGTCTLPSQVPAGAQPSIYVSDGCNINANTMPGGSMAGYNQGMTAVHETGHWLGLLHTFEGYSCEGDGDLIDDTPFESQSTNGCPAKPAKNSCPSTSGVDPIHNYMDYSTDDCYTGFSPLQIARIDTLWKQFRLGQ